MFYKCSLSFFCLIQSLCFFQINSINEKKNNTNFNFQLNTRAYKSIDIVFVYIIDCNKLWVGHINDLKIFQTDKINCLVASKCVFICMYVQIIFELRT